MMGVCLCIAFQGVYDRWNPDGNFSDLEGHSSFSENTQAPRYIIATQRST
jgi:hypothetical protein